MPNLANDEPLPKKGSAVNGIPEAERNSGDAPSRKKHSGAVAIFLNPYMQVLISILLNAASQIFLKIGALEKVSSVFGGLEGLSSGWVWLSILAQVFSLLSWLYALRFVRLSIAYNLTNLMQVIVPVSCWIFLGENIDAQRWCGICLVLAGVFIIARPVVKMEEHL